MEDGYIKELVGKYQEGTASIKEVEEYLSIFVYKFPFFEFRRTNRIQDFQGDFYLYFYDRLPKILLSYKQQKNVQFKTYLYLVLKRHYINFLKSQKEKVDISLQSEMSIYPSGNSMENQDDELIKNMINRLRSVLSEKEILLLKLFVPEILDREDVGDLSREIQLSFLETQRRVVILSTKVAHRENKNRKKAIVLTSVRDVAHFLGIDNSHKISKRLSTIRRKAQFLMDEINEMFGQ